MEGGAQNARHQGRVKGQRVVTEPTATATAGVALSASLTGAMAAAVGPVLGPWLAVAVCALAGGMWAVGRSQTGSRLSAVWLLARILITAVVLSGAVASLVSGFVPMTEEHLQPFVAFCLGAIGDKFDTFREDLMQRFGGGWRLGGGGPGPGLGGGK